MYNKNIKPIYNYDLQECNLLFKKGIHPIGCGVGDKDGRVFHVFMADRRYFEADREDIGKQIKEIGGWIKKLDIKNKIFFSAVSL